MEARRAIEKSRAKGGAPVRIDGRASDEGRALLREWVANGKAGARAETCRRADCQACRGRIRGDLLVVFGEGWQVFWHTAIGAPLKPAALKRRKRDGTEDGPTVRRRSKRKVDPLVEPLLRPLPPRARP